jgi:MinD-like ATPase involved in chromosome partitioning or flagellar assembly
MALLGVRHPQAQPRGVVALWPTSGSPGASTVAAALAAAFAARADTILVDCDQTRGTLESLLAPLPGMTLGVAVARRPHDDDALPDELLDRTRWGARFLPGLVGPAAPVAVDPCGLAALLDRLRRETDILVLDLGEELPSDLEAATRAVRGEAAVPVPTAHERAGGVGHAAALWLADVVLVVARDTPQGKLDLRGEYPLLHRVLSRAPRPPAVGAVVNELETGHFDAWSRLLKDQGLPFLGHVPHDRTAVARAWSAHAPLTYADRHSKAAKALVGLADAVERLLRRRHEAGAGAGRAAPAGASGGEGRP